MIYVQSEQKIVVTILLISTAFLHNTQNHFSKHNANPSFFKKSIFILAKLEDSGRNCS